MPILYQITTPMWLQVDAVTRNKISEKFSLPRTGQRAFQQMRGVGEVTCDGHSNKDLAELTLEKMNKFLGEECPTVFVAFEKVVEKVEGREYAVKGNGEVLPEITTPGYVSGNKKFCDHCDSRGVKHQLTCTRPQ